MIIWERLVEPLIDALVRVHSQAPSNEEFEKQAYGLILNRSDIPHAYECPKCGRLAVFTHASDANPALWLQRERVDEYEADSIHSMVQWAKGAGPDIFEPNQTDE